MCGPAQRSMLNLVLQVSDLAFDGASLWKALLAVCQHSVMDVDQSHSGTLLILGVSTHCHPLMRNRHPLRLLTTAY